jgi:beta-glucosidase-like glycosyl hydrolase
MNKHLRSSIIALLLVAFAPLNFTPQTKAQSTRPPSSTAKPAAPTYKPYTRRPSSAALAYANKELRGMTLDEKIGQLISVGINAGYTPQDSDAYQSLRRQIVENHVGGIILFRGGVYESVHLVNRMQTLAKRPLLISADLEAGAGMRFDDTVNFPWNMAIAATGDPELARRAGQMTARESRALGVHQVFAPVVDVNNNAANPVINVRSYGEDPREVARFGAAFTEGLQRGGVIATAKHFPGHGDTSVDSHRGLPIINVSRARLDSIELVPFRETIAAGVGAIMPSHIALPQLDKTPVKPLPQSAIIRPVYNEEGAEVMSENATLPATLSPKILTDILRKDLNFDGMIVTDAMDMSGLTIYFTQSDAAVRAVQAGADVLLKPADADACIRGLREAVQSGTLTEKRIEESARRVLVAKFDLGLVANRTASLEGIDTVVSTREVTALANEIAGRAITLVRNDARLLPVPNLTAESRVLNLAITNGEDRLFIANSFTNAARRLNVKIETVVLDARSSPEEIETALERAGKADLVIASLYGRVQTGKARSVGLPDAGARALNKLIEREIPTVGISFGNPYLLMNFTGLQTYLVAYGDMPSLQQAAARAIFGRANIAGRLPISLPGLYARGTGIEIKAANSDAAASSRKSSVPAGTR